MKRILKRMAGMCTESWYIFSGTLKLSCFMLLCAFALLSEGGAHYETRMLASALYETPQGLLLIATLASLFIEDRHG